MTSAQIILVVGATGAGKTHLAQHLAATLNGLRFSIDDWMTTLFWMDSPEPIQFDWTMERIGRCEAMIWSQAEDAIALNCPAILDLGFTTKAHRAAFGKRADEAGYRLALHFCDVPVSERWHRVEKRNAERGMTYAMQVDRAMFDFMEARWEAPEADEMDRLNGVCHHFGPETTAVD